MKRSSTAVIGLGNYLLADEGAGMHAVELLRKKKYSRDVDLIDAGTPGMNLLHQFEGREKIIFIDSGKCGNTPGDYSRFKPDDVISLKKTGNHSLHEFDLIAFLEKAKEIGFSAGKEIIVYCMEVAEIKMSQRLSRAVQKGLPKMTSDIFNEIEGRTRHA